MQVIDVTDVYWRDHHILVSGRDEHFASLASIDQLLEKASYGYSDNALVLQSKDPGIHASYTINDPGGVIDEEAREATRKKWQKTRAKATRRKAHGLGKVL